MFHVVGRSSFYRMYKRKSPVNTGLTGLFAVWTRLELATPCVTGRYSNQLNYQTSSSEPSPVRTIHDWMGRKDSTLFVIPATSNCDSLKKVLPSW